MVVGFILLLVPGIYWAGTLPLSFVALVIEDTGVSQSMAVSRGLIKGYWWSAATLISYVVVIELVAYFAGVLVTGGVGAILGVGGAATLPVSQVLSLAIDTLIAPLIPRFTWSCTTTSSNATQVPAAPVASGSQPSPDRIVTESLLRAGGGTQHGEGCVGNHGNHQPAQPHERQRLDDVGGDEHADYAAEGESQRRTPGEFAGLKES